MLNQVLIWGGLLVVVVLIVVVVRISPRFIIGILTYGRQARDGELQVGDPAPAISLVGMDGATVESGEWLGDQPQVLVFGSFT